MIPKEQETSIHMRLWYIVLLQQLEILADSSSWMETLVLWPTQKQFDFNKIEKRIKHWFYIDIDNMLVDDLPHWNW